MSHGSTEGGKVEPNFTPLLDLVLQLVMFFMLCANFVLEQTNVEIKLPQAIAAKAIDAKVDYTIFLNVGEIETKPNQREWAVILTSADEYTDSQGVVTKWLTNPLQVENFLKRRAKEDMNRIKEEWRKQGKGGEPSQEFIQERMSVLILRVHKECPFEKTYGIMKACRLAGYQKVQLRAIRYSGAE